MRLIRCSDYSHVFIIMFELGLMVPKVKLRICKYIVTHDAHLAYLIFFHRSSLKGNVTTYSLFFHWFILFLIKSLIKIILFFLKSNKLNEIGLAHGWSLSSPWNSSLQHNLTSNTWVYYKISRGVHASSHQLNEIDLTQCNTMFWVDSFFNSSDLLCK